MKFAFVKDSSKTPCYDVHRNGDHWDRYTPESWNDVVGESLLWLGTGMVYVVDFLPFSVASESSLMHVHFFPV